MAADQIRNVVVIGQGGVGKTSIADALLFAAGATTRLGRVDDESSVFDTEPEEHRRKSSVSAALHRYTWRKEKVLYRAPIPDKLLQLGGLRFRVHPSLHVKLDFPFGYVDYALSQ